MPKMNFEFTLTPKDKKSITQAMEIQSEVAVQQLLEGLSKKANKH